MYLLWRCICIFELATSCGQRTITFLSYSEAVVRLPCRATSRPNSRCRYKGLRLPFRRRPIWREIYHRSFIFSSAVDFCGLLRFSGRPLQAMVSLTFRPCICRTSSVASSLNYSARRRWIRISSRTYVSLVARRIARRFVYLLWCQKDDSHTGRGRVERRRRDLVEQLSRSLTRTDLAKMPNWHLES